LAPRNTPRTPSYLLPCVIALATFSVTALLLYKVYLSLVAAFHQTSALLFIDFKSFLLSFADSESLCGF
jgi:hypothetical protein